MIIFLFVWQDGNLMKNYVKNEKVKNILSWIKIKTERVCMVEVKEVKRKVFQVYFL